MRAVHSRLTSSGLGSELPARRVQASRMLSSALAEEALRSDREDLNVLLPTRCELSDTLSQFLKRCMRETQDCKSVFLSPRLSQFFKTGIVA